jgi:hypothetical protein
MMAGDGTYSTSTNSAHATNWQNTGLFRGVFSGNYDSLFYGQGDYGLFWSSSVYSSFDAFGLYSTDDFVDPFDYDYRRYRGFGMRCLLDQLI